MFRAMIPLLLTATVFADVPGQINHQGLVKVNGTPFTGTGLFRFAIFDPDTGQNYWTNDNTFVPGPGTPTAAVSIQVTDGIYSVMLGDTSLTNMTNEVPPSIFKDGNAALRVWFNDGVNGIQQFDPHPLTSTPYTHQAQFQPPIGSIMAWHKSFPNTPALPDGWVECNGQALSDSKSPYNGQTIPDLNSAPPFAGGRFLRGGATSGIMQDPTGICTTVFPGTVETIGSGSAVLAPDSDLDGLVANTTLNRVAFTDTRTTFAQFSRVRPVNMSVVWIMRVK